MKGWTEVHNIWQGAAPFLFNELLVAAGTVFESCEVMSMSLKAWQSLSLSQSVSVNVSLSLSLPVSFLSRSRLSTFRLDGFSSQGSVSASQKTFCSRV